MLARLIKKCETLTLFIPTNAYIHSPGDGKMTSIASLRPPAFLARLIEESLPGSLKKGLSLPADKCPERKMILSIDPFRLCYLTWSIPKSQGEYYSVTLGPFLTERLSAVEVRHITHELKLGSDAGAMIEAFMGVVPTYTHDAVPKLARLFQDCLDSKEDEAEIITEDHAVLLKDGCEITEEKFETLNFVEENYAAEGRILQAIEQGDMEFVRTVLLKNISTFNMPPRYPNDPLREIKNLSITLNSISLRAAIKGGINRSLAHNMSHAFAVLIEQQSNAEALHELDKKIISEYTQAVRDYGLRQHTELITKTVQCVRRNLASPLSLSRLAREVAVSREHLCRQFRRELGITLTDFIHRTKIRESCSLLASRKYTISDIALTFGYSSPAHYTKMFTKIMGASPKRWQAKTTMAG